MVNEFRQYLKKSLLTSLDRSIDELGAKYGDEYFADFEKHLSFLSKVLNVPDFPRQAASAFIKFNKEILKEELAFRETGQYSSSDFGQIRRDVYENPEVMGNYYLTGLYLTYFIWPHHYRLLRFYRDDFLAKAGEVSVFMEWGVGHGLLSQLAFTRWPSAKARLYDVSPFSLQFAQKLLASTGFSASEVVLGDVTVMETGQADAIICGELLEHVPDPRKLLRKLRASLRPGARAFMTGAINSAQEDHLTLFSSVDQILQLVTEEGFTVAESVTLIHPNRAKEKDAPTVLALVLH